MSTKSHIHYENDVEIYEDSLDIRTFLGKILGYDVTVIIEFAYLKEMKVSGDYYILSLRKNSYFPEYISLWGGSVPTMSVSEEGIMFSLEGGTKQAKNLVSKNWDADDFNYKPQEDHG